MGGRIGLEKITETEAKSIFWRDLYNSILFEGLKVCGFYLSSLESAKAVGQDDYNKAAMWGIVAVACAASNIYRSTLIWRDFSRYRNDKLGYVEKYIDDISRELSDHKEY